VTKLDCRESRRCCAALSGRLLHGIFGVNGIAKNIRASFSCAPMHRVETFIGAQIAGPAGSGQCGSSLAASRGRAGAAGKLLGRFTRSPFAQR